MAKAKSTKADEEKVDKDHAATGKPVSPTEDPADHSVPAGKIAAQVDPKGTSGATVNAASIEAVNKDDENAKAQQLADEDKTIVGKIRRSELFMVHNHVLGENYVGISPQNDPNASAAEKRLSAIFPLDTVAPRTGMIVKPKEGNAFAVGDGFGPDKTPLDWGAVQTPEGEPLFA